MVTMPNTLEDLGRYENAIQEYNYLLAKLNISLDDNELLQGMLKYNITLPLGDRILMAQWDAIVDWCEDKLGMERVKFDKNLKHKSLYYDGDELQFDA